MAVKVQAILQVEDDASSSRSESPPALLEPADDDEEEQEQEEEQEEQQFQQQQQQRHSTATAYSNAGVGRCEVIGVAPLQRPQCPAATPAAARVHSAAPAPAPARCTKSDDSDKTPELEFVSGHEADDADTVRGLQEKAQLALPAVQRCTTGNLQRHNGTASCQKDAPVVPHAHQLLACCLLVSAALAVELLHHRNCCTTSPGPSLCRA